MAASEASEPPVDPRIQVELEHLNATMNEINSLELHLDEARAEFRHLLSESAEKIDSLAKKLSKHIEQARSFYESKANAKELEQSVERSAREYQRANSNHAASKELVELAEKGLVEYGEGVFDASWQEMLNHCNTKVNDAEIARCRSFAEHQRASQSYELAEAKVRELYAELQPAIRKSSMNVRRNLLCLNNLARMQRLQLLPYFEMKEEFGRRMEVQKQAVQQLEQTLKQAKHHYSLTLKNLETISHEIHESRNLDEEDAPEDEFLSLPSKLPSRVSPPRTSTDDLTSPVEEFKSLPTSFSLPHISTAQLASSLKHSLSFGEQSSLPDNSSKPSLDSGISQSSSLQ